MTRVLRGAHCQCACCREYFNSTVAFDKHRMGEWTSRRCLTAKEMRAKGMLVSATGWWLTSAWKQAIPQTDAITGTAIGSAPYSGSPFSNALARWAAA
jgi:hypothetical protein